MLTNHKSYTRWKFCVCCCLRLMAEAWLFFCLSRVRRLLICWWSCLSYGGWCLQWEFDDRCQRASRMETTGFVNRLVSCGGTALFVALSAALVSFCWSAGDIDSDGHVATERDLGGSSADENSSGTTVDAEPLFQSSPKIAAGKRWILHFIFHTCRITVAFAASAGVLQLTVFHYCCYL